MGNNGNNQRASYRSGSALYANEQSATGDGGPSNSQKITFSITEHRKIYYCVRKIECEGTKKFILSTAGNLKKPRNKLTNILCIPTKKSAIFNQKLIYIFLYKI